MRGRKCHIISITTTLYSINCNSAFILGDVHHFGECRSCGWYTPEDHSHCFVFNHTPENHGHCFVFNHTPEEHGHCFVFNHTPEDHGHCFVFTHTPEDCGHLTIPQKTISTIPIPQKPMGTTNTPEDYRHYTPTPKQLLIKTPLNSQIKQLHSLTTTAVPWMHWTLFILRPFLSILISNQPHQPTHSPTHHQLRQLTCFTQAYSSLLSLLHPTTNLPTHSASHHQLRPLTVSHGV